MKDRNNNFHPPLPLIDNFGRSITYLRLAVTDRCNLRCRYCMPEGSKSHLTSDELLTWNELLRLSRVFRMLGIKKVRITGGEPFVRPGLLRFISQVRELPEPPEVAITTNGVMIENYLTDLKRSGVKRLNFSLDSLNPRTFKWITGKSCFDRVVSNIERAYSEGFKVKINLVVLPGVNEEDIPRFVEWTRDRDWTVRFIEVMPFDTYGGLFCSPLSGREILRKIQLEFALETLPNQGESVAILYKVDGYRGNIGIINGFSRTFCDRCSRLRVSGRGQLRTCLYGKPVLDLRSMLRNDAVDEEIIREIRLVVKNKQENGFKAAESEKQVHHASMSAIGG